MNDTLHLRIKKEYAAALLEHLKKEEAIEIIEDEVLDIPEWQKEAVRKTLAVGHWLIFFRNSSTVFTNSKPRPSESLL